MLAVCLPSTATAVAAEDQAAQPRFEVHERRLTTVFGVGASNGYEGLIGTRGHKQVGLLLIKGKTIITAQTSGLVTRRGIEADFGDLGSVSVRFFPGAGNKARRAAGVVGSVLRRKGSGSRCHGRKPIFEEGVFRGRIRFQGENGFTRIDSKRAAGFVQRRYRRVCPRGSKKDPLAGLLQGFLGKLRFTTLQTQGRADGARLFFEASAAQLSGRGTAFGYEFKALAVEHREGMRLTRSVNAAGDEGSFLFSKEDPLPRTATITPEKPFAGSAEYVKEKGGRASWTGTLTVRLPGVGQVPLIDPRFRSAMCRLTFRAVIAGDTCMQGPPRGLLSDLGGDRIWAAPQPRP